MSVDNDGNISTKKENNIDIHVFTVPEHRKTWDGLALAKENQFQKTSFH